MGRSNEVGVIPYEKSNNVETSLFNIQGRITRKDFFIRTLLCVILWGLIHLSFLYLETPNYNEWVERGGGKIQSGAVQVELRHKIVQNIDYYILPSILMFFLLIQSAKRVHDTNHSSKCLLIPFYNVYLLFSEGSPNDNDYGLLPHVEVKSPSYKSEQTETIRNHKQTPNKIKNKKLNINWDDVLVWTVHRGIYCFRNVAALGWGGAITVLLFTILTIYSICGGFGSADIQKVNISHDNEQNVQAISLDSAVTPININTIQNPVDTMTKIKEKIFKKTLYSPPKKKKGKQSQPYSESELQEPSQSAF